MRAYRIDLWPNSSIGSANNISLYKNIDSLHHIRFLFIFLDHTATKTKYIQPQRPHSETKSIFVHFMYE